jgi:hypothetical protein
MSGESVFGGGRNLDQERRGQRAQAPTSMIRKPLKVPPMERVRADLTAVAEEELRRRAADGDDAALAELNRRAGVSR